MRFGFAVAAALFVSVSGASAQTVPADNALQLQFSSDYDVGAIVQYTQPDVVIPYEETGSRYVLLGGNDIMAGDNVQTLYGDYDGGIAPSTPVTGTVYGLSTLDQGGDVYTGTDKDSLHLVLVLDADFADEYVIGREFTDAFSGFTSTYDGGNVAGYYPGGVDEEDFIDEVLYSRDLFTQYGLPYGIGYGPQTNLLFDFGSFLQQAGGLAHDGRAVTLVAFSAGKGIGFGTAMSIPNAINIVPEPATWALMILGFGAIGGSMRRRSIITKVRFA